MEPLLFIERITDNQPEFEAKVRAIAARLMFNPDWLMAAMYRETGGSFSPSITNGIGATGLIQFTRSTATGLGTTTAALAQMSKVEQLNYVEQYLLNVINQRGVVFKNYLDLYLAIFYPAFINAPDTAVLPDSAYAANRGMDVTKNGNVTKADVNAWFLAGFPTAVQNLLKKKK